MIVKENFFINKNDLYRERLIIKIFSLIVLLAVVLSFIAIIWLRSSPEGRLRQAQALYSNSKFKEAIDHYEKIGRDQLAKEDLRFLVDSYLNLGKFDEAKAINKMLAERFSSDTDELIRQANFSLRAGDNIGAKELYNQAIQKDNTTILAYRGLANILKDEGKLAEAYKILEDGAKVESVKLTMLTELASFADSQKDYKKAYETYYEVFKIDPQNSTARKYLLFLPDNNLEPTLSAQDLYTDVPHE